MKILYKDKVLEEKESGFMYKKGELIQTKMNIPPTKRKLVGRWKLFHRLDEVFDYRLALIAAPAGFGKTTLISAWVKEKGSTPIAWISLDEDDNIPHTFWNYFLMALSKILPKVKEIIQFRARHQNFDLLFVKAILSSLINEVSKNNEDFIVILDDFLIIIVHSLSKIYH